MIDQEKIHNQCISNDPKERNKALEQLESDFLLLPDKQKAWDYLIKLTSDKDSSVRSKAASTLCSVYSHVPDKEIAWSDLIRLTKSGPAVPIFHRLLNRNSKIDVRKEAAKALVSSFPHMPDKQKAWDDLHKLINDKDWHVKYIAAFTIGFSFSDLPDKQQAWSDLYRLMKDDTYLLRPVAAAALGSAFEYVPDKQKALNDLIKLTTSENSDVRRGTASALGFAYSNVPDKQKLWNILIELSSDQNRNVRNYANHSLGKICIFQASIAEKEIDYKNKLETAIKFFEKASQESEPWSNPSQFCLPFYRSFHTIIFERQEAKEEVNKYLEEAKEAVQGSKNKELLFEAVDNLANAVKQVQNLENMDLEAKKSELSFYRDYCDHASELMRDVEGKAPSAAQVIRKSFPILDRNLKELLEGVKKKAKIVCQTSQGTPTQEIARDVNREVQKLEIGNQDEMDLSASKLALVLKSKIPHNPENKEIFNSIESVMNERDLVKQYRNLFTIITLIPTINVVPVEPVIEKIESSKREMLEEIRKVSEKREVLEEIRKVSEKREVLEEIRKVSEKVDDVVVYVKPGIHEDLILHLGPLTPYGGIEYTLTIPLNELSYSEIKDELNEISGKRINKLSQLPKKIAKIVEDYLLRNKMEDLLNKLRSF
ncbi:HEAT repeat domain-containing protein [Methanosarcina barkeri]|uniref:Phosphorylase n=1 Tax=Methanosarcina barkeri 227 TaxID=1434106 RepID=A0A0E3LQW5_METBA|nr:HEAT repeat domain-containing protein [Methanosarcina barkeri]AKB58981.1 phosphorylase [Methanosarcina barkeri 227]